MELGAEEHRVGHPAAGTAAKVSRYLLIADIAHLHTPEYPVEPPVACIAFAAESVRELWMIPEETRHIVPTPLAAGHLRTSAALEYPAIGDDGTAQVGPAQVGPAQVGPAQVGTEQVGPDQVGPAQVGPAQVGHG